jgi:hypothetical protein
MFPSIVLFLIVPSSHRADGRGDASSRERAGRVDKVPARGEHDEQAAGETGDAVDRDGPDAQARELKLRFAVAPLRVSPHRDRSLRRAHLATATTERDACGFFRAAALSVMPRSPPGGPDPASIGVH